GHTVTYVNRKAFSAGAFISFATQKIYMAPQSVIGAAAPIMLTPGGTRPEVMPDTMEAKISSGVSALVRASAEKNGYNVEVADAMVKRTRELKIGDKVINEKGEILTLTDIEAAQLYGQPPKSLLSSGTVASRDALLERLGYTHAQIRKITPSGVEKLGSWINTISPILLMIGAIGIYLEFKMPGVILPGIIGVTAFAIYFLGGYVAGFSGAEWVAIFIVGLVLVAVELFVFPGTIALGLAGVSLMIVAILMAMVDMYPGMPSWPTLPQLRIPLQTISIAFFGSLAAIGILAKFLPKTSLYGALVSQSASGVKTDAQLQQQQSSRQGQIGVTISALRPGGKAQFGEDILDVMSQGDLV
ncbi:MAG: NfeD family protein, partial [Limisphaerales bacterium]